MTLAPVFRSDSGIQTLHQSGLVDVLAPALHRQRVAVAHVRNALGDVIGPSFVRETDTEPEPLESLQQYFFLTLFLAALEQIGVAQSRLDLYAELDFCIMGTITAADNLLDDEAKSLLPLRDTPGRRFAAVLELMCFERLVRLRVDQAMDAGVLSREQWRDVQRELLDAMGHIGRLEGSEERGIDHISTPEEMLHAVHRVRGGRLFGLAMVAPHRLETGAVLDRVHAAESALVTLGTAFQVVDDLTDFEHDIARRTNNLLVSWIYHRGTDAERRLLAAIRAREVQVPAHAVEGAFAQSGAAVLQLARKMGRDAFTELAALGLAVLPEFADDVVDAIAGMHGDARIAALQPLAGRAA